MSGIPRLRAIANREIEPVLVPIKPYGRLEETAAASKARIDQKLGFTVSHVGAYRSYAEQAAKHATSPNRFARPQDSEHVVGLALDVHAKYAYLPEVIAAFESEGWHRYDPQGSPWHWSYGVVG